MPYRIREKGVRIVALDPSYSARTLCSIIQY